MGVFGVALQSCGKLLNLRRQEEKINFTNATFEISKESWNHANPRLDTVGWKDIYIQLNLEPLHAHN